MEGRHPYFPFIDEVSTEKATQEVYVYFGDLDNCVSSR